MSQDESFEVLVTEFAPGDEPPAARLQRVFGISSEAAERLLLRLPAPVQRNVPRVRAEYFRRALLKIGAHVEVRDSAGVLIEAAPSIPPPAPVRTSRPPDADVGANATWPDPNGERKQDTGDVKWLDAGPAAPPLPPALDALAIASAPAPAAADTLVDQRVSRELMGRSADATVPQASPPVWSDDLPLPISSPPGAPVQQAWASRSVGTQVAAPAPLPLGGPELPQAVRSPAHPTMRETREESAGAQAVYAPPATVTAPIQQAAAQAQPAHAAGVGWGDLTANLKPLQPSPSPARGAAFGTAATDPPPSAAPFDLLAPQPSDAVQPLALPNPLGLPELPSSHSAFQPPPLELGLGASEGLLTRMPSSVWDAPPPAGGLGQAPRRAPLELDAPAHVSGSSLNTASIPGRSKVPPSAQPQKPTVGVLAPWEQPPAASMSEPAPPGQRRAPPSGRPLAAEAVPARPAAAREKPAGPSPAAKRRRRKPSKDEERPAAKAQEPFATAWPSALSVPFAGMGARWIASLCAWAFLGALLSVAAMIAIVPGAIFTFLVMGSLLALACDYFAASFEAEGAVERAPDFSLERLWHGYVKGGAQLAVFALVVDLPVILWVIDQLGEGATLLSLLAAPITWLLTLHSIYLWPAAIEQTIAQRHLGAVWNVPAAVRRIARAPGAYSASAAIGALVFGVTLALSLGVATLLDARGVMLLAAFGPPIALGHGVLGALLRRAS